jgi:aminoglycoside phosphotransferase (APT) family kinase protein
MSSLAFRREDLVARGNTSDVFSWSSTTVIKVLRPDMPSDWARHEAEITRLVREAGFPVPAVEDVVLVEGRPAIVFERVDGLSMWEHMKNAPNDLQGLTSALVDLQCSLHCSPAPAGLPDLQARLIRNVGRAEALTKEDREVAAHLVGVLPAGTALCHGDMHPRNILMSRRGMVLIDWFDAAAGNPVADIARSSLLIRPQQTGELDMHHLQGASVEMLAMLHDRYMSEVLSRRPIDQNDLLSWEAAVAAARLAEPVPKGDLLQIWRAWREGTNGSEASTLAAARRPGRS